MNNLPTLYIGLIVLFAGITACASLLSAYTYFSAPHKKALPTLVFNFAAFIFVASDALALFFAFTMQMNGAARFFVAFRELLPLMILIVAPYFLNQVLELKPEIRKINQVLFWIGTAVSITILTATAFRPDLFIITAAQGNPYNYPGFIYNQDIGPLFIVRGITIILYMLYAIAVIIFSKIHGGYFGPIISTLIGLIILCYFSLTHLYFILFTDNQNGFGTIPYPHIALGGLLFILCINLGAMHTFAGFKRQLNIIKRNLNQTLYYDASLGIPNRMGLIKDLQLELNRIETEGGNFSLIFIDIDDFGKLNECYGESIGDEILKMLSHRLIEYFSWAGTLYRTGGDEFAFLTKGPVTVYGDNSLAGKIVASLRNPFSVSGKPYLVTASLGVLQIPDDGKDTENILINAYNAVRGAKKAKNTFMAFTHDMTDSSIKKVRIVNLLRESMDRDQFTLVYQPVVGADKNVVYAEALLRCTNPDPSIDGPGTFIPIIEEAGLIGEVDNMVIRKAFHDMEMHIKKKFDISINLSTNQLVNPAYCDFLSSFAEQHGIENRQIILEVTETILMKNMEIGRENLLRLKNSGFRIAIDDFGKGFSSLTYLAELPVDTLKMDMLFVQAVPGDKKKEAMAKYVIELAHSLNLKVSAEGFELPAQFKFFRELGCDLYQGYYFSRPVPLDELLAKYPAKK